MRANVQAVVDRLRLQERGNFVSIYYDNEGEPSVVFQFLRDGPKTLRKYTSYPRFSVKTVRWSTRQLLADQDFMMNTFAQTGSSKDPASDATRSMSTCL